MKELGDRAAQGRAYGNLGNTHYLLGSFTEATTFHKEVSGVVGLGAGFRGCPLGTQVSGWLCWAGGAAPRPPSALRLPPQRLAIAKEFGDKAAERRAYSNLGNAHIFLGRFDVAAEYYK